MSKFNNRSLLSVVFCFSFMVACGPVEDREGIFNTENSPIASSEALSAKLVQSLNNTMQVELFQLESFVANGAAANGSDQDASDIACGFKSDYSNMLAIESTKQMEMSKTDVDSLEMALETEIIQKSAKKSKKLYVVDQKILSPQSISVALRVVCNSEDGMLSLSSEKINHLGSLMAVKALESGSIMLEGLTDEQVESRVNKEKDRVSKVENQEYNSLVELVNIDINPDLFSLTPVGISDLKMGASRIMEGSKMDKVVKDVNANSEKALDKKSVIAMKAKIAFSDNDQSLRHSQLVVNIADLAVYERMLKDKKFTESIIEKQTKVFGKPKLR